MKNFALAILALVSNVNSLEVDSGAASQTETEAEAE